MKAILLLLMLLPACSSTEVKLDQDQLTPETRLVFGKYKDIMRRIPDLTKAKNILGYQPKTRLKDAIVATIQEIKNGSK